MYAKYAQEEGGNNDEDEGGEYELVGIMRVVEAILRECTGDGGRESCSDGSAARDRDSVFSSNRGGESEGHTPAGTESVPTQFGTNESSSSSSTLQRA